MGIKVIQLILVMSKSNLILVDETIKGDLLVQKKSSPGHCGSVVRASSHAPKVGCSISSQSTYLGCGFDPHSGWVWEVTSQCFSLSLYFSLKSINIFLKIKRGKFRNIMVAFKILISQLSLHFTFMSGLF